MPDVQTSRSSTTVVSRGFMSMGVGSWMPFWTRNKSHVRAHGWRPSVMTGPQNLGPMRMGRTRTDPMATNSEIEMRWVEAWNDLLDIVKGRHGIKCLLPDGAIVDVEECKGWLQDSVYQGYL